MEEQGGEEEEAEAEAEAAEPNFEDSPDSTMVLL